MVFIFLNLQIANFHKLEILSIKKQDREFIEKLIIFNKIFNQ